MITHHLRLGVPGLSFVRRARSAGIVAVMFALSMALSGCNTVAGAGKDIQGAGESIEGGAEKTKEAIDQAF